LARIGQKKAQESLGGHDLGKIVRWREEAKAKVTGNVSRDEGHVTVRRIREEKGAEKLTEGHKLGRANSVFSRKRSPGRGREG